VSIDRGEGHPINARGLTDLPVPPPVPAGMAELAALAARARRILPEPGGRTRWLVLECGAPVAAALSARQPGRPEYVPHPGVAAGEALTYRQVAVHTRDGWGLRWRLLDDDELLGEGELGATG
jgi:hypothetical protein